MKCSAFILSKQNVMSLTDFKTSREASMASFNAQYDELKTQYRKELDDALKEEDRATQCVHIKDALQTNKKITELVQGFLATTDPQTSTVTQDQLRNLHADVQSYRDQHAEIQQGRDKLRSLENAYASVQDEINIAKGIGFWYLVGLIALTVIAVAAMAGSSIRSALNTQSVPSVFSGSFAQPRYF
jgi:DNA-binding ferritin-like protein